MKDQYVGDINDFLKYGLLRILARTFRIGVCWMLTENGGPADGKRIEYLNHPNEWQRFDPGLFATLCGIVHKGSRCVRSIQEHGVLSPADFFSERLVCDRDARSRYFSEAFEQLQSADVLFFDPDNGLEVKSCARGTKHSSKYLYWDEVRGAFKEFEKSLLIYQHFPREKREKFIAREGEEIQTQTGAREVYAFKTPRVVFFLAVQPKHSEFFQRRIEEVERSSWHDAKQIVVCRDKSETR